VQGLLRISAGFLLCILLISSAAWAVPTETDNLLEKLVNADQLLSIINDESAKKPLIIDVRSYNDYVNGHIPGAIWIAPAAEMGSQEIGQKIRRLLDEHVASGGANEIVVYCYTGNSAGLVAGVLGERGFNIKNLRLGFDGWASLNNQAATAGLIEKGSGTQDAKEVYAVVRPFGDPVVPMIEMAPRLDTLDGKRIAVVGHSFNANITHPEIKRLILENYPTAKVYLMDEVGSAGKYPAPGTKSESVERFQRNLRRLRIDAVIAGNGG